MRKTEIITVSLPRQRAKKKPGNKIIRNYGCTSECRGCRYWSELIAKSGDNGVMTAMCLNNSSKFCGLYMYGRDFCGAFEEGQYGAIDDPNNQGVY